MTPIAGCIGRHAKKKNSLVRSENTLRRGVCLYCAVEDIPVGRDDTLHETLCTQTTITHFTSVLQIYSVTNIRFNVRTKTWVTPINNRERGPSNRYRDSLWSNYRIRLGFIFSTRPDRPEGPPRLLYNGLGAPNVAFTTDPVQHRGQRKTRAIFLLHVSVFRTSYIVKFTFDSPYTFSAGMRGELHVSMKASDVSDISHACLKFKTCRYGYTVLQTTTHNYWWAINFKNKVSCRLTFPKSLVPIKPHSPCDLTCVSTHYDVPLKCCAVQTVHRFVFTFTGVKN